MTRDEIYSYIKENPKQYLGYYELGKYLVQINEKQAFLCFENALFFSESEEEKSISYSSIIDLLSKGVSVPKMAIVILSYNKRQLTQNCLESLRKNTAESSRKIIIVDNASSDDSVSYLKDQKDIIFLENKENTGFPKGCNQGIELADPDDDILLLNNDTVVMPNALFWLRMALYERESIGIAGSVSNNAFYQNHGENNGDMAYYANLAMNTNIPADNVIENRVTLIGFCMLLKRTMIDKIGVLDERFTPGNYEDDDICYRSILAGYENVLVHNSYIVHLAHASFVVNQKYVDLINTNHQKISEKYGYDLDPFRHEKSVFMKDYNLSEGSKVLEINCSLGANLFALKYKNPAAKFYGIDSNPYLSRFLNRNAGAVFSAYSDISILPFSETEFDLIIFDTTTIQKEDLDKYIDSIKKNLKPGGMVAFNVLNSYHYINWAYAVLDGKMPEPFKGISLEDLETSLKSHGIIPTAWTFFYPSRNDGNKKEAVDRILDALSEDRKNRALVSNFRVMATI